ncbi:MAG: PQQ-dependent sugar dehydrogenase, partial [Thermomicrobiales bacterium]
VGQGAWEEVDFLPAGEQAGANLGWSLFEGTECYSANGCDSDSGLVMPFFTISHSSGQGCSVTGGSVIRGDALPGLDGVYLFADYCYGLIWASARDSSGDWQTADPMETGLSISSFGTGPNGEVYIVDLTGSIYQLVGV